MFRGKAQGDPRPRSDVSAMVGWVGLAGLAAWVAFARSYPEFADWADLPGPREVMSGPHAALAALFAAALPMALWSLFVDKVHRNPSTGIDWSLRKGRAPNRRDSLTKIVGLWATFAVIAALYCLARWYWSGNYLFSLKVIGWSAIPLAVLTVPYIFWIDRVLERPRDHAWHFGRLVLLRRDWEPEQVYKHWRIWGIKAFFTAFMISITPFAFHNIVTAEWSQVFARPERVALLAIEAMFMVDVVIGSVGYIVTMRPLDAHIRSGNPFLGGWVAALICYPPLVWGILGNGQVIFYEENTRDWVHWFAREGEYLGQGWLSSFGWAEAQTALVSLWGAIVVFLTAIYAWATLVFGLRFSNLTYRGVVTHGPYRLTRHPAYVSKNLFWWFATMPFMVTSDSWVDVIRNCFFLLVVNAIYYWRAKTEEAHLLAEDDKYREYHAWMARNGWLTAPLAKLTAAFKRRFAPQPSASPSPVS